MQNLCSAASLLVLIAAPLVFGAGGAPLRVSNWAEVPRDGWPATGGVPLPRGALTDLSYLAIVADGRPLPLQTEALAHWDDGSVKWVLLDFPATIPAGESVELNLQQGGSHGPAGPPEAVLQWEETDDGIAIDTGPLRATIGPRLIHKLSIREDGAWREIIDEPGDLVVTGNGARPGEYRSSLESEPEIEVEQSGPQRICVCIRGWHRNEAGERFAAWILRVHAFGGKPYLKIHHTFINSEFPEDALMTGIGVEIPVSGAQTVDYGGTEFDARGQTGSLAQREWNVREIAHGGREHLTETSPDSYLALTTPDATVCCAMRDIDRLHPKELALTDRGMTVWMWPPSEGPFDLRREEQKQSEGWLQFKEDFPDLFEEWCDPGTARSAGISAHRYRAAARRDDRYVMAISNAYGLARTHEFWLGILPPDATEEELADFAANVREPLIPFATPEYVSATRAMGQFGQEAREDFPRSENYIRRKLDWLMHHQNEWHRWWGILDWGGTRSIYERYGGHVNPGEWWKYLGRHGWHNSEVEIPCHLMYQYLRTGQRRYWHLFEATQRHQMDVDTIHLNLPEHQDPGHEWEDRQWIRGGQHRHSYNHYSGGANDQHSWNEGLAYYYLLTGDRRARDVAVYVGEYTTGSPVTPAPSNYEKRINHRLPYIRSSMLCYKNALSCYMITGEQVWRDVALMWRRFFLDNPHYIEEAKPTYQITTYMIHSLSLDWNLFHDREVADEIVRIARWHCDFIREGYEERGLKYPYLACGLAWRITGDDELLSWPWYRYLEQECQSGRDTVRAPDDFFHGWFYEYGQLPFFLSACADAGYSEANPPPQVQLPE
jgi:hypothetical protein